MRLVVSPRAVDSLPREAAGREDSLREAGRLPLPGAGAAAGVRVDAFFLPAAAVPFALAPADLTAAVFLAGLFFAGDFFLAGADFFVGSFFSGFFAVFLAVGCDFFAGFFLTAERFGFAPVRVVVAAGAASADGCADSPACREDICSRAAA